MPVEVVGPGAKRGAAVLADFGSPQAIPAPPSGQDSWLVGCNTLAIGGGRNPVVRYEVCIVDRWCPRACSQRMRQFTWVDCRAGFDVRTAAVGPQEAVQDYVTQLHAMPNRDGTHVTLSTEMKIKVRVPRLFRGHAVRQVAKAAARGLQEQEEAIAQLVAQYADERIILPELGR